MEKAQEILEPIVCEIELRYCPIIKASQRPQVTSVHQVYEYFLKTWDVNKIEMVEQFKVMLLTRAKRILGVCTLSSGNAISTIADPKQVFAVALKANATEIIIAHNHPSGQSKPSTHDHDLTMKIKQCGILLDMPLIDHFIITPEEYYSFAEEGTL